MNLQDVKAGQAVIIEAKSEFFSFVDGWHGRIAPPPMGPLNNGLVVVQCTRADGVKTFTVPPAELVLSVG